MRQSVELVVSDGEGEHVFGPFATGLLMNDCSIWEPGSETHPVAEWSYAGDGQSLGWEVQLDPAFLWPVAHIRGCWIAEDSR